MPKDVSEITKKRILCVGGAGYIGSRLVPALLERGHEVEVVDLFWFGDHLPPCHKKALDASQLTEQDLEGFDTVIWLGGLSNDPMANFSPSSNFIDNASTPAYLAYISRRAGVRRFIHGGSCSIYGYAADCDHDEASKPSAVYPYGVAKLMAETGCGQQADRNFSVIMIRKGTVCGYSPRMRFDLIINTMFKDAALTGLINVSHPDIWRPILAIEDAVQAYVRATEADKDVSGLFNILSENVTVMDVAERVAKTYAHHIKLGTPEIIVHFKDDPRNYRVDGSAARRILGFSPQGSVETITSELCARLDEFGDFANPSFYNIETFKKMKNPELLRT